MTGRERGGKGKAFLTEGIKCAKIQKRGCIRLSGVQFSWCMSGNRKRLCLKINFANAKLNEGFERQRQMQKLVL